MISDSAPKTKELATADKKIIRFKKNPCIHLVVEFIENDFKKIYELKNQIDRFILVKSEK